MWGEVRGISEEFQERKLSQEYYCIKYIFIKRKKNEIKLPYTMCVFG